MDEVSLASLKFGDITGFKAVVSLCHCLFSIRKFPVIAGLRLWPGLPPVTRWRLLCMSFVVSVIELSLVAARENVAGEGVAVM